MELPTAPTPDTEAPQAGVRRRSRQRDWVLLALALLLLAGVFLPPLINLGRYQRRLVSVISTSLGRPVHMREMRLRLLPWPAIVMRDFEVEEDPAFGAEPALRAPSVVAQLRLASLWRGELEVDRIDLDDASINLVRDKGGRWNADTILLKASALRHTPGSAAQQARQPPASGGAPRFPYVSASNARINFKQGVEKTPFSLLNADVSMWLSGPDDWQLRLEAQPVRTDLDLDLSDTGLLRVDGKLHRSAELDRMPVALKAEWTHAPVGQISRLLLGRDAGWRGDLRVQTELAGELDDLDLQTHVEVGDLHRQEFTPAEPFDLDTTCRGRYRRLAERLDNLQCRWPVSDGALLLTGDLGFRDHLALDLQLTANHLPASFGLAALRLTRNGLAPAMTVGGLIDGTFSYSTEADVAAAPLTGSAVLRDLSVTDSRTQASLAAAELHLASSATPGAPPALLLLPTPIGARGAAHPLTVSGRVTADEYLLHWAGSTDVPHLAALAELATGRGDLIPLAPARDAEVDLDLTSRGSLFPADSASSEADTEGSVRLRNVRYAPAFLPEPVQLPAATITLSPGVALWGAPAAIFHRIPFAATASVPLHCPGAAAPGCVPHFDLGVPKLDAAQVEAALLGAEGPGLLTEILARLDLRATRWPALAGTVRMGVLTVASLSVRDAAASVTIAGDRLTLEALSGRALGGALKAQGSLEVSRGTPHYTLAAAVTGANASAAGSLFDENWGPGALDFETKLDFAGYTAEQLTSSATGTLQARWDRGALPGNTPLARFTRWTLDGTVAASKLTLTHSELIPAPPLADSTQVRGTIGFDRTLALTANATAISGTVPHPVQP